MNNIFNIGKVKTIYIKKKLKFSGNKYGNPTIKKHLHKVSGKHMGIISNVKWKIYRDHKQYKNEKYVGTISINKNKNKVKYVQKLCPKTRKTLRYEGSIFYALCSSRYIKYSKDNGKG